MLLEGVIGFANGRNVWQGRGFQPRAAQFPLRKCNLGPPILSWGVFHGKCQFVPFHRIVVSWQLCTWFVMALPLIFFSMQGDVRKDLSVYAVYSCPHSWCWRAHCSHVSCLIAWSYCCVLNSRFSSLQSTFFVGETLIFCYLLLLALNRVVVSTQNKQMVAFGWDMGDFICFFITSCFALACLSLSNVEALRSSGMLRSSTWLKWRLASRWSTSFRCVETLEKRWKKRPNGSTKCYGPVAHCWRVWRPQDWWVSAWKTIFFLAVWPITACGDLWIGILTLECWLCVFSMKLHC